METIDNAETPEERSKIAIAVETIVQYLRDIIDLDNNLDKDVWWDNK